MLYNMLISKKNYTCNIVIIIISNLYLAYHVQHIFGVFRRSRCWRRRWRGWNEGRRRRRRSSCAQHIYKKIKSNYRMQSNNGTFWWTHIGYKNRYISIKLQIQFNHMAFQTHTGYSLNSCSYDNYF